MKYSYNLDRKEIVFAHTKDINASFKDLCAVCDSIRYKPVPSAIRLLDSVINEGRAVEFRRHNKYMGSRHELGGKKGRYPIKCARILRKVVVNAYANAKNKGQDPESMYVVHASANKTQEIPRMPSKGVRAVGGSRPSVRRSNIEFAKIEIGIASKDYESLSPRMKRAIKAISKREKPVVIAKPQAKKHVQKPKSEAAKQPVAPKPQNAKPIETKQLPSNKQETPKPLESPKTEQKSEDTNNQNSV